MDLNPPSTPTIFVEVVSEKQTGGLVLAFDLRCKCKIDLELEVEKYNSIFQNLSTANVS